LYGEFDCGESLADWLTAVWLAFAGRESNPLDDYERFPFFYIMSPFTRLILM
jgi:hypothetical protein